MDDHTRGKHEVLREYLKAWFPIMARYNKRLVFVDGFAGPGEYEGGEPGSPVIAMETYRQALGNAWFAKQFADGEMVFLFVEQDATRASRLNEVIAKASPLPGKAPITVHTGDFETAMSKVLDKLPPGKRLAPAFVMVDPFGVKDYPLDLLGRLLKGGKVELYISFMYEFISRFAGTPEFEKHLTELYGTDRWKEALKLTGDAKRDFLFGLYADQLRSVGAKHVLRFDLYRDGRNVYSLFFATQHHRGADVMKQAMWKVDPFGDFAFRGRPGQLLLGVEPDFTPLRQALLAKFKGVGWVAIEMIEEFVASDETDFHTGQYKKAVLVQLEKEGLIEVDPGSRKKARTYPDGTRLRFV